MAIVALGCGSFHHRARLFPLPFIPAACPPPCSSSCRVRAREKVKRTISAVTNRCIFTLNRLYASPSFISPTPPVYLPRSLFIKPQPAPQLCFHGQLVDFAAPCSASASQLRITSLLRDRCARFVTTVRIFRSPQGSACVSVPEPAAIEMLNAVWSVGLPPQARPTGHKHTLTHHTSHSHSHSHPPTPLPTPPSTPTLSSFSSASTPVVVLIASRVSLPDVLDVIQLDRVLPENVSALYTEAASAALMRPFDELAALDAAEPLRRPRIAGKRSQYVKLVARMHRVGMLSFTSAPLAVNGVFTVAKDADADRLIIDAQPANRLFINSPHVSLPNPSHLVKLQMPSSAVMFVAKSDLSNYYHLLGLPVWMQRFFALPPLTPAELRSIGVPVGAAFPMCVTLPMGFSHAVFLAQTAHEHVVYGSGALRREDSLLHMLNPAINSSACIHGIVIDDLFIFGLSQKLCDREFAAVAAAYRAAGFVVKQSKVVAPTAQPVKIIGFNIDGTAGTIELPVDSQRSLIGETEALLRAGCSSSTQVAHVVGRWTWLMMLRRPSLAVLQHVYRWIRVARGPRFNLWPRVRSELTMLLGLMPLLSANLRESLFHRVIASDASELAAGVVSTPLTPALHRSIWPLCSSRHVAALQCQHNGIVTRHQQQADGAAVGPLATPDEPALLECVQTFRKFYSTVAAARWTTLISTPWRLAEHINALELRAALLAVHWAIATPAALSSRLYLLLDSTSALFSLWKGRSSSPQLLRILRKVSALLLAGGVSLLCGWIPSAVNPADDPSRLRTQPALRA